MSEDVKPVARKSRKSGLLKLAYIVAGFCLAIAVVFVAALWRLAEGPVSLDFLTPVLERTFIVRGSPLTVRIDKTILTWGGWRRFADLRVRNVRLFGSEGKLVAILPDVSVGVSLQALLQRRLALSRIEVHGMAATLERFTDGRFAFALPATGAGGNRNDSAFRDATSVITQLVRSLEGPMRDLRRVAVIDARLRYIDRKHDKQWLFPQASFSANILDPGIEARMALRLEMDGERTMLAGTLRYDHDSGRTGGRINFRGIRPQLVARAVPELSAVSVLDAPLSGNARFAFARSMALRELRLDLNSAVGGVVFDMTYPRVGATVDATATLRGLQVAALVRATPALASLTGLVLPVDGRIAGHVDAKGRLNVTQVDLTAGAGRIEAPGIFAEPLRVRGGRLRAILAPGLASAEIRDAWLEVGDARLSGTAEIRRAGGEYRVRSALALKDLGIANLGRYWPLHFAGNARRWVRENISTGAIREANVDIVLRVPVSSLSDAVVESVDGSFSYEGLNVRYWSPLPPAAGVGGTARFDGESLRFTVTDGHVRDVAIEQAVVGITGFAQGKARAAIELGLRGSARTVLQVLDRAPLRFTTRAGILPDAASGDAIVRSRIGFPIDESLAGESVDVKVTARVGNVGLKPAPYGLAVEGGDIEIKADRRKLKLTGAIRLGELPVSIDWVEEFGKDEDSRRIELSGRLPDLGKIGLGLPTFDFLAGPADAKLVITSAAVGVSKVTADFDFAAAELSLPDLRWRKARGEPGRATLRMLAGGADGFRIEGFRVETADTSLEGAAAPMKQGAWRIRIDRFKQSDRRLSGTVEFRSDRSIVANLHGDRFDLAPLFVTASRDADGSDQPKEPPRRIKVNAVFDSISWGKDRLVDRAKLSALRGVHGLEGFMLEGRTRGRGSLGVKYLPGPEGLRLDIEASDFGAALSGILPKARIAGGSLVVRGRAPSPGGPLKGAFVVKDFAVRRAPTLARLLQAASLTGIAHALSGKGLKFDDFKGEFAYENGMFTLKRARAFGSTIGITLRGDIHGAENRVALGGTLVPAYTFNRVIGTNSPVGPLATGSKDESLFAAAYRVAGPFEKPTVSVNPLSVLAPGFLRNLFGAAADTANSGEKPD